MKIAILSDVHANFIALEVVSADIEAWRPDLVVVAGDLVNRGPRPLECLSFVLEKQRTQGWLTTIGNHEEYVIYQARPEAPCSGPAFEVHRASCWTHQRLGEATKSLEQMPFSLDFIAPDRNTIRVTHASMGGTRDGVYHHTTDEELSTKMGKPPTLFLVGHTHIPLIRRLNGTLVVNSGSAGLPFDGDYRPSYTRLTWQQGEWQAEIKRIPYDLHRAEQDFLDSGYLEEAGPLIPLVVRELRQALPQLGGWAERYQKQVLAAEISMDESVQKFIQNQGQKPIRNSFFDF